VKLGSTVEALLPPRDLYAVYVVNEHAHKRLNYFLVNAIASCAGNMWFAVQHWQVYPEEKLKTDRQPVRVNPVSDSQVFFIRSENLTHQALVLKAHNVRSFFPR